MASRIKIKNYFIKVVFFLGYSFLYIPIFLIVLYSFNKAASVGWQGFSLKWYHALWANEGYWQGAIASGKIAFTAATLSVILGTMCASLWTTSPKRHRFLGFLATMPLVIPEMITGLSILLLCVGLQNWLGWPNKGFGTVVAAHTTLGASYAVAIIRAQLLALDPSLSEAALNLGARPHKVFFLIKLPIIAPSLISSWLIAFVLSFDDVVLASFTAGPGTITLPLMIFSSLKMGYSPQLNALATCMIAMVSIGIMVVGYVSHRRNQKITKPIGKM